MTANLRLRQPERFAAFVIGVGPGHTHVGQHPVVELAQMIAFRISRLPLHQSADDGSCAPAARMG